jgi:hypothetical protein
VVVDEETKGIWSIREGPLCIVGLDSLRCDFRKICAVRKCAVVGRRWNGSSSLYFVITVKISRQVFFPINALDVKLFLQSPERNVESYALLQFFAILDHS